MVSNSNQTQELAETAKASLATYRKLLDDKVLRSRLSIILGTQVAIDDFEMYFSKVLSANDSLLRCDINSLFNSVVQAWKQQLVIGGQNSDACIIPYGNQAQLQMEWRGLLRLAKLADPSLELHITEIVENEIASYDAENGKYEFNKLNFLERLRLKDAGKLLGFYGRLRSNYCTELQIFMSEAELARHGLTYSKSYNDKGGAWQKAGLQMRYKTIAKKLLNRFLLHYNGQATGKLKWALEADQATFGENGSFNYADNPAAQSVETVGGNFIEDTNKVAAVAAIAGAFSGEAVLRDDLSNISASSEKNDRVICQVSPTSSGEDTKNLGENHHLSENSSVLEFSQKAKTHEAACGCENSSRGLSAARSPFAPASGDKSGEGATEDYEPTPE